VNEQVQLKTYLGKRNLELDPADTTKEVTRGAAHRGASLHQALLLDLYIQTNRAAQDACLKSESLRGSFQR